MLEIIESQREVGTNVLQFNEITNIEHIPEY